MQRRVHLVTSGGDIEIPRGKIATACDAGCNHNRCFKKSFVRLAQSGQSDPRLR